MYVNLYAKFGIVNFLTSIKKVYYKKHIMQCCVAYQEIQPVNLDPSGFANIILKAECSRCYRE